jgi:hypothetical protein
MRSAAPQQVVTIPIQRANAFIARHHRHHLPPSGAQLAVGLVRGPRLVGVAILGRPVPPAVDDGATIEVTRTGTDHAHDHTGVEVALYRASWHVARVYGYHRLITHTHLGEITRALRAVGLRPVATVPPRARTHTPVGTAHGRGVDGVCRTRWEAAGVRSGTVSSPRTTTAASHQRHIATVCADGGGRQPRPQEGAARTAKTSRWAA